MKALFLMFAINTGPDLSNDGFLLDRYTFFASEARTMSECKHALKRLLPNQGGVCLDLADADHHVSPTTQVHKSALTASPVYGLIWQWGPTGNVQLRHLIGYADKEACESEVERYLIERVDGKLMARCEEVPQLTGDSRHGD